MLKSALKFYIYKNKLKNISNILTFFNQVQNKYYIKFLTLNK